MIKIQKSNGFIAKVWLGMHFEGIPGASKTKTAECLASKDIELNKAVIIIMKESPIEEARMTKEKTREDEMKKRWMTKLLLIQDDAGSTTGLLRMCNLVASQQHNGSSNRLASL
jgi:hypothetical protein